MGVRLWLASACLAWGGISAAQGTPGTVRGAMKLSETSGGFLPQLDVNDQLGRAVTPLGDLDGDGVPEIATAGHADDDGGLDRGCAYVMFLRRDGRVKATQKISMLAGGFVGPLRDGDQMGRALAGIGDLDGDGVPDLAAGANFDDDGGRDRGAVWILFLNPNGTVKAEAKISSTRGGLTGLDVGDEFGRALAGLGDFDGDGVPDLAVAAPYDDDGGSNRGAVYLLFLRPDGTVKAQRKISQTQGGFRGQLRTNDVMGFALCSLGDFDGNGVMDLVAGANLDDDGAINAGAIWLLLLNADGSVLRQQKISALAGGFTGVLESPDQFGDSVAAIGDLNGDGRTEIAVGAVKDGDGGKERGAVWILFPNADGTVAFHQKISSTSGGLPYRLDNIDWLGSALCPLGDLNQDGVPDVAIGARNDDDGGANQGAVYVTFLNGVPHQEALQATTGAPSAAGVRLCGRIPSPGRALELVLEPRAPLAGATPVLLLTQRDPLTNRSRLLRTVCVPTAQSELSLPLPDDPRLEGATLRVELAWLDPSGRLRERGQPLELVVGAEE